MDFVEEETAGVVNILKASKEGGSFTLIFADRVRLTAAKGLLSFSLSISLISQKKNSNLKEVQMESSAVPCKFISFISSRRTRTALEMLFLL